LVTARPSGTLTLPPVAAWHGTSWVRESSCAVFGVPSAFTPYVLIRAMPEVPPP
jgi:hypothetical protein